MSCGAAGQQVQEVPGGTWRHRPGPRCLWPAQATAPGRSPRLPAGRRRGPERPGRCRRRRVRPPAAAARGSAAAAGAPPAGPVAHAPAARTPPAARREPGRRLPAERHAGQRRAHEWRAHERGARKRRTRERRAHERGARERGLDEWRADTWPAVPAAERAPGAAARRSSVPAADAGHRGGNASTVGSAWVGAVPGAGSARRQLEAAVPAAGSRRSASGRRPGPARVWQPFRGSRDARILGSGWERRDGWGSWGSRDAWVSRGDRGGKNG
jgi:hypothetical protein